MTEAEFTQGMIILQGAAVRKFPETVFAVWWEALRNEFAGHFLSVCRELARHEEKITLPLLCARLDGINAPQKERQKEEHHEAEYRQKQETAASEAERIVGASYQSFLDANNGDHRLACLYFGQAYWKARGITRYDHHYQRKIEALERRSGQNTPGATKEPDNVREYPPVQMAGIALAPGSENIPYRTEEEPEFTEENLPF